MENTQPKKQDEDHTRRITPVEIVSRPRRKASQDTPRKGKDTNYTWKSFQPEEEEYGTQRPDTSRLGGRGIMPSLATLEFVQVDEPMQPPTERHRKVVRRHVMRNFHEKRKEKSTPMARPKQLRPSSGLEALDHNSKVIGLHPEVEERSITATHDRRSEFLPSQERSFKLFPLPPVRGFLQQFDGWMYDTTVPFALMQAEDAPILYITSRNWPFPQPLGDRSPKRSLWMPNVRIPRPNFRLPRSCMHKSFLVHPAICSTKEYFSFKLETIQWINKRLPDIEKGTNDATIGSILLLVTLETARGNIIESLYHMNGLEQIISLRGGIEAFTGDRHFLIKLFLTDLIVAVIGCRQPLFGSLPTLLPSDLLGNKGNIVPGSPLYCRGALLDSIKDPILCNDSRKVLQHLQDITILATADTDCPTMKRAATECLMQLRTERSDPPTLLRIIHLTGVIYCRALQNPPIAFSSYINQDFATELCHALESPEHDDFFDEHPGVLLWILLTTSATINTSRQEHGFIISLLTKVAFGAGYGWWEELNLAMRVFLKIKMKAEV